MTPGKIELQREKTWRLEQTKEDRCLTLARGCVGMNVDIVYVQSFFFFPFSVLLGTSFIFKTRWVTVKEVLIHRDPSMYTAYGPRGRYWNPASPVRLTWSQLDRSNFACARSAVTSLVPLERKETQPFFGTSLKKIGESAWVHELRKVFSAFWGKLFGLLGKTARNDPWAWRLV